MNHKFQQVNLSKLITVFVENQNKCWNLDKFLLISSKENRSQETKINWFHFSFEEKI